MYSKYANNYKKLITDADLKYEEIDNNGFSFILDGEECIADTKTIRVEEVDENNNFEHYMDLVFSKTRDNEDGIAISFRAYEFHGPIKKKHISKIYTVFNTLHQSGKYCKWYFGEEDGRIFVEYLTYLLTDTPEEIISELFSMFCDEIEYGLELLSPYL